MWRKGKTFTLLVDLDIGAATMEKVQWFLKKLKLELLYDQTILLLWVLIPKKTR